jgi:hypothetical protein
MKCANASKVHRKSGSGLGYVWLPALRACEILRTNF